MAEFDLTFEVKALTEKFDGKMDKIQSKIDQTDSKITEIADEQKGMGKLAKTAGKAVAAFAAIEIGAKAINTVGQSLLGIMDSFAGNSEDAAAHFEGALNAAKQLPFGIGGAIDAIYQLSLAVAGVDEQLRRLAEMEQAAIQFASIRRNASALHETNRAVYETAVKSIAVLKETNDIEKERLKINQDISGKVADIRKRVAEATALEGRYIGGVLVMSKGMADQIRENAELTVKQLERERDIRIAILKNMKVKAEQEEISAKKQENAARLIALADEMNRIRLRHDEEGLMFLAQEVAMRDTIAGFDKDIREAREEGNEQLARSLEMSKKLAVMQLEYLQNTETNAFYEDQAAEAAKKAAEEEEKRLEKQAADSEKFLERKLKMEEELAEAREEASSAVAGATSAFSTAGGSFTTAVSAQVDESKLLRSISEQSRDFLEQIVQNTASMGLGFA